MKTHVSHQDLLNKQSHMYKKIKKIKKNTCFNLWGFEPGPIYLLSERSGGEAHLTKLSIKRDLVKSAPERINTGKPQSRRIFIACCKKMCSFFGHGFFFDRGRSRRSWCSCFFRFVLIGVRFGHNKMNATLWTLQGELNIHF